MNQDAAKSEVFELPQFEPRIPEFLLGKMSDSEAEIFKRLDVNSQQTEHTLRIVLEGKRERHKLIESVDSIKNAHAEHCVQDKRDFGDLRFKQEALNRDVTRCASILDRWSAKVTAFANVFFFFFGRKGLLTMALGAVVTWFAIEYAKAHFQVSTVAPTVPAITQKK